MKKSVVFMVCLLCAVINLQAQYKINVQNGTKAEFYDNLETAIEKAVSGDTLYLPGTALQVENQNLLINKKLTIIGAGWDVDSIGGLQTTEIKRGNGYVNIHFNENSSGSLLTGCMVQNVDFVQSVTGLPSAENITIRRNRIHGEIVLAYSGSPSVKNINISENYVSGSIHGNHTGSNSMVNNNLVGLDISYISDSRIFNNVVRRDILNLTLCTVENNFIGRSNGWNSNVNCIFNNNAYQQEFTPGGTNSTFNNTLTGRTIAETFAGDISYPKYAIVLDTSPCKAGGTHGTEIGIYGGNTPYKAGAIPFNPHITESVISGQTDNYGNLKINIKVSAQSK